MLILTIRTDKPEAELGIFHDHNQVQYEVWHAHRELSQTIHQKINEVLARDGKTLQDLQGIVVYQGPGSFTGLRIGLTVANVLAHDLSVPIAGITPEENWIARGIDNLLAGKDNKIVLPEYGAPAHITQPRK
jgi:tRNA threonylcarbamoyladenosine biosynthesis protein TsaB